MTYLPRWEFVTKDVKLDEGGNSEERFTQLLYTGLHTLRGPY